IDSHAKFPKRVQTYDPFLIPQAFFRKKFFPPFRTPIPDREPQKTRRSPRHATNSPSLRLRGANVPTFLEKTRLFKSFFEVFSGNKCKHLKENDIHTKKHKL